MAADMYGLYPNIYNNQVALNDLTDMDLYSPLGMANPIMGMNGSIFNAGVYPIMPGIYGGSYNYEDYYKNYDKYQNFLIESRVRQQQKMREADIRLNSPEEGIAKKAAYLHEKIMRNEQQQIQLAYNDFKESVRSMYPNATEEEISNRTSTLYKRYINVSLTDDIRKHGRGSFTQGFLQTVTLGFADNKTAEENISDLTGLPVGRTERTKKIAGNIAGGAIVGGGGFLLGKVIAKALGVASKSRTFWGIAAGAIGGLIATIVTATDS